MADVEVHIDLDGETRRVGLLRRYSARARETISFEYDFGMAERPEPLLD